MSQSSPKLIECVNGRFSNYCALNKIVYHVQLFLVQEEQYTVIQYHCGKPNHQNMDN